MELNERIQARIEELRQTRDKYRIEAQKQLYAYDAVIGELMRLLEDEAPPDDG